MSTLKIKFFFIDVKVSLSHREKLKSFILQIFKKEQKKVGSLNYIFCTDKYLLKINSRYLNHNYYTDILTFDLSTQNHVSGDIYISIPRVKQNAKKYSISFSSELKRVMFHGALHLCGHNDKTTLEISLMRKAENKLLLLWRST